MALITDLPDSTITNTTIPKEKFYQVGDISHSLGQLFIDEVEKIVLHAIIAPRTMNVSNEDYDELHVFETKLKGFDVSQKVLELIDTIVPRPILFVITRTDGQRKYVISYKEPKAKESSKSKVIQYYASAWSANSLRVVGSSVKSIYINFIRQIDSSFDPSMSIEEAVATTRERVKLQAQIDRINTQIRNEPSLAKKQELARQRHSMEEKFRY